MAFQIADTVHTATREVVSIFRMIKGQFSDRLSNPWRAWRPWREPLSGRGIDSR